jgi:hypothetical protein
LKEKVVRKVDVFEWWVQNKFRFPNIFHFVKKYLIVPATSVPAERVFSKAVLFLNSITSNSISSAVIFHAVDSLFSYKKFISLL